MAIQTALYQGRSISIDAAVAMKKANGGVQPNIFCDKCGWDMFVCNEQLEQNAEVTPPYFQHYPMHPICEYDGGAIPIVQARLALQEARRAASTTETPRETLNYLFGALRKIYRTANLSIISFGESIQTFRIRIPELTGPGGDRMAVLVGVKQTSTAKLSPQELTARQGVILRASVVRLISSVAQSELPVQTIQLIQWIEELEAQVKEIRYFVALIEVTHPHLDSARFEDSELNATLMHIVSDLALCSLSLARTVESYLHYSVEDPKDVFSSWAMRRFERIDTAVRNAAEIMAQAEVAAKTVEDARKEMEDIKELVKSFSGEGWDAQYFADLFNCTRSYINKLMKEFEQGKRGQFEVGPQKRRYTHDPELVVKFKKYAMSHGLKPAHKP